LVFTTAQTLLIGSKTESALADGIGRHAIRRVSQKTGPTHYILLFVGILTRKKNTQPKDTTRVLRKVDMTTIGT
jgi:hypothetical protein